MILPAWLAAIPWRVIVPVAGALALATGIYVAGRDHGRAACEARWQGMQEAAARELQEKEAIWRATADKAARDLAEARARAGAVKETRTHEVRTYYRDRPVAAAVECLPDERVRAANSARAAIHSATAGG